MPSAPDITPVSFDPPGKAAIDIEALSVAELRRRGSDTHFRTLQRANFYRLIGVQQGATRPMIDFAQTEAMAGDWLLVRPGQVFRYDFDQPWAGWLVVFRPEALFSSGRRDGRNGVALLQRLDDLPPHYRLDAPQHAWMLQSVAQLAADGALDTDNTLRNELLRLQLLGTLLRLSLWQPPAGAPSAGDARAQLRWRRFRTLLETDFARHHQVAHYAHALGMSDKTLSRLCVASAGLPAKALIDQRIALEARRLLAHTSQTVEQIADSLGFGEPTNFSKFFRRAAGLSPSDFRRAEAR